MRSLSALAARAQLGDRAALEELLRRLERPLREHIASIVRDDDAAADVLQDTLLIVCRRLGSVREVEWVRAWAYRVATREAWRAVRKSGRHPTIAIEDEPLTIDPRDSAESDERLLAELPARIASLPAGSQAVLRLHYLESMTQQEVAEALEIPLGTVKSRVAYGLQSLRRTWKREDR